MNERPGSRKIVITLIIIFAFIFLFVTINFIAEMFKINKELEGKYDEINNIIQ